jgi:L-asparaginase
MQPRVVLIGTGGTISMADDAAAGGAVPALRGQDLCRYLSDWTDPLEVIEHSHLPSAHFTLGTLWGLCQRVQELARQPDLGGMVIAHGTDVMEETAYLLDLTVEGDAPMVLTGAMRAASDPGYEGPANLLAALRVAADPGARGIGAVVVMENEIHAARWVTKMHTTSPRTFQSPFWGPLGRIEGERVILHGRPERHILPTARLEEHVLLIKLAVGMDDGLLRYPVEWGMRGVVLETLGGGRVPPWWMPTIREAVARGVAVVITSRCPAGLVGDHYGYAGAHRDQAEAGALFAWGLNGPKARLKLMAALGAGLEGEALRQAFMASRLGPAGLRSA